MVVLFKSAWMKPNTSSVTMAGISLIHKYSADILDIQLTVLYEILSSFYKLATYSFCITHISSHIQELLYCITKDLVHQFIMAYLSFAMLPVMEPSQVLVTAIMMSCTLAIATTILLECTVKVQHSAAIRPTHTHTHTNNTTMTLVWTFCREQYCFWWMRSWRN